MRMLGLIALCAVCVAACGRADDERTVTAVTTDFLGAVDAQQGERGCARLAPGTRDALEQDEGDACADALPQLDLRPSRVLRAQVYETAAKVDLVDGDSAFLELTRRGWRVSAAGCTPGRGDEPYSCELDD